QGEACPIDSGFIADQDRATIAKSSTLPYDSAPRVTSPAADKGSMQQTINELTALCTSLQRQYSELAVKFKAQEIEITRLKARVKLLEDREGRAAEGSRDDAPIKGRNLDEGEATAERASDDTEKMATVLTSMDAATVLASGDVEVPTGSGSIPTAGPPAAEVPIGSDVVPTASPVFATATMVTPYRRRKGKEVMEYHQFALELPIKRRIELISDVVKYQDNYAKIYKFQGQQRKPWTKKQKRDYYMSVIRSNLGWKIEDFIPMGLKEEAERIKRKGLSLEPKSAKKFKPSEEVIKEAKSPDEVPEEKIKEMMQLVSIEEVYVEALQVKHLIIDWKVHSEGQRAYWKITRLGGSSASYQLFIDLLKHLDREDLNQLWRLVKETLSNRPPTSDKEMELWVELSRLYELDDEDQLWTYTQNLMHALVEWKLYDSCGVHHVTAKDKKIFMLVEKDYPLRRGLALVMISYKLQVENYSRMANDLISKIYKIASTPRQQEEMATVLTSMDAATVLESGVVDVPTSSGSIPTASTPAEEQVPTGSWKVKDFRGMTFEEVEPKFNSVWKQTEDFIPMGSKEEAKRIKRKGINLKQESVYHEGQRSYWKITRLGGSSASYQFFIDLLKHLDIEDLNQLWRLEGSSTCDDQLQAPSGELLTDGE
nr:hypothetical protein [Tanacetum cinerariifolium]